MGLMAIILLISEGFPITSTFMLSTKDAANLKEVDVNYLGSEIRNFKDYQEDGINVNFVEIVEKKIFIRTYERGVENETLSCGTGVVASVLAANEHGFHLTSSVEVKTLGGNLNVSWLKKNEQYNSIILSGPVSLVFCGELSYEN